MNGPIIFEVGKSKINGRSARSGATDRPASDVTLRPLMADLCPPCEATRESWTFLR